MNFKGDPAGCHCSDFSLSCIGSMARQRSSREFADYPIVGPAYAARRSELAKKLGLGTGNAGRKGGRKPKTASA
jgi:hypothetical protein